MPKAWFDVFLSHNSRDKDAVTEIAQALKDQFDARASYTPGNGLHILVSVLNINYEVFGFYQGVGALTSA